MRCKDAVKNAPWSVMDTYDNVNDAQQYFSALVKNTQNIYHIGLLLSDRNC